MPASGSSGTCVAPWTARRTSRTRTQARDEGQATAPFMPPLSGDGGYRTGGATVDVADGHPAAVPAARAVGRRRVPAPEPTTCGGEPVADGVEPTPADLDRAALESCVGGGFFPGIEVSSRIRTCLYVEDGSPRPDPYRLDHETLQPGGLTERMAVPWQADFAECEGFWWPAQRPDQVVTERGLRVGRRRGRATDDRPGPFLDTLAFPRRRWARGIEHRPLSVLASDEERTAKLRHGMVEDWSRLGFVVPRVEREVMVWTETERDPYYGLRDRDYFHLMLNLDQHPEFRPVARELAERFLAEARRQAGPRPGPRHRAAAVRLRRDHVPDPARQHLPVPRRPGGKYDPDDDGTFHSREDVIERIRQFAPLNQTDGALAAQRRQAPGHRGHATCSADIWDDETGGGNPQDNHAHIYTELMREPEPRSGTRGRAPSTRRIRLSSIRRSRPRCCSSWSPSSPRSSCRRSSG